MPRPARGFLLSKLEKNLWGIWICINRIPLLQYNYDGEMTQRKEIQMKDLQLHATRLKDNDWLIELYNPNIGVVEVEGHKNFSTVGQAQVWADTIGEIDKTFDDGETIWVSVPANEKEHTELLLAL
jgi:hypothetical protein